MAPFEAAIGRQVLGNAPASGTEIIARARGGAPARPAGRSCTRAATPCSRSRPTRTWSASRQLYEWCRSARRLLDRAARVGRVIARPFEGEPGAFVRSPERRDFSVPPPGPTVLDRLAGGRRRGLRRREDPGHLLRTGDHRGALLGLERPRRRPHARVPRAGRARRSCSRTSWTSTRSTATATTRPATRPRSRRSTGGCPS